MKTQGLTVVAMFFMNLSLTRGARILGIFPIPSFSHQIVYRALMTELHSRGHEIVILTSHPIHNPRLLNYTEIDFSSAVPTLIKRFDYHKTKESEVSSMNFISHVADVTKEVCQLMFNLPGVQTLLNKRYKNESFDLVITGWHLTPCTSGFAYHFSAPLIGISTLGLFFSGHNSLGNPTHPVYFTELFNSYLKNPTFLDKLERLLYYMWFMWLWHTSVLPQQDKIARQNFGDNMPYLENLDKNVSLVFTALQTSHYAVTPKVPALIELGAIHLKEVKPLSKELQEYLDGAAAGAIYFSFGTNIQSDKLSKEKRKVFLDVFSQMKGFRIIWKWDGNEIPNLPSNVKIGKWFPQLDVLAHSKMKAFIYQGGLQSTEEAIKVELPVIGFPFAVDQDLNLERIVDYGAGIKLDFNKVTRDILFKALKEVIFDPKYKSNMKRLSDISKDQPQTPMERAVWWTEYVIRYKGAPHLRCATTELTWYQYLLLDVIAFIVFSAWISHYLVKRIYKQIQLQFKHK